MKISTGAPFLDTFLEGGYESGIVTTVFGPSGSGKTNICLLAAVRIAEQGKQVIFVDTEGGIAVDRIKQLSSNTEYALSNMKFFRPTTFTEQRGIFATLSDHVTSDVGLIVVDSISMLYRLALGQSDDVYSVNSALGQQLATLVEIARKQQIPVLITNQVYADFDNREMVKMVGGDLLKYGSKCLLEVQRNGVNRRIVLRKHRCLPEGGMQEFTIVGEGILPKPL